VRARILLSIHTWRRAPLRARLQVSLRTWRWARLRVGLQVLLRAWRWASAQRFGRSGGPPFAASRPSACPAAGGHGHTM
jgi:hypothetical protein